VILGHVLEHVSDPIATLQKVFDWLNNSTVVFAAVPNARSLHRQAAVQMGLLSSEFELNDTDRKIGHRRIYSPESLRNDFNKAGFAVQQFGGYWLKPVSNAQIIESWSPEMLAAFMQLGERYPDVAGEIYVVARKKS